MIGTGIGFVVAYRAFERGDVVRSVDVRWIDRACLAGWAAWATHRDEMV